MGVPRCLCLAGLLLFRWPRFRVRFDTLRRRRFLRFPFLNAQKRHTQEFLSLGQALAPFLMFFSPVDGFFFAHGFSFSERSRLNTSILLSTHIPQFGKSLFAQKRMHVLSVLQENQAIKCG
jgi:hypothetical protein